MLTPRERNQVLDLLDQAGITDVYFWRDNLVVINDYDYDTVERVLAGCAASAGIAQVLDSGAQEHLAAH
jgi:hypothetical protein